MPRPNKQRRSSHSLETDGWSEGLGRRAVRAGGVADADKLKLAEIAMQAGGCVIANGMRADVLDDIFDGQQVGTTFMSTSRMAGKRRWLTYAAGVRGRVIVNEGAREAIISGKASLLSSGVVRVEQQFEPQDVVSIADCEGARVCAWHH